MDAMPALRPLPPRRVEKTPHRGDEYAQKLRDEFEVAIRKLRLPGHEEVCVADMFHIMERLYDDLPPRGDGALPMTHITRVGLRLAGKGKGRYGIRDKDILIAGIGHDGVEDHAEALARLGCHTGTDDHIEALQYISDTFGVDAAAIIAHTTRRKTNRTLPREERISSYREYVKGVTNDPRALIVKIADVYDNTTHPSPDAAQRAYSMEKYWNAVPTLQEGLHKHRKYILGLGGHMLLIRLSLDLMQAKRRASVWKQLAPHS